MKQTTTQIKLIVTGIPAFMCIILFAGYKIDTATIKVDEWLLAKKQTAISCSFNGSSYANGSMLNSVDEPMNYPQPGDKNKGRGCSHQTGANALWEIPGCKRNGIINIKIKIYGN